MPKSAIKDKLKVLGKKRLGLRRKIEDIRKVEKRLLALCQHEYDDGSNAWKPVADKSGRATVMYCVICRVFVKEWDQK